MIKKILCDGDSWTAGDIVDPKLFGDKVEHVHHPDNDQYRLPKVWPHKLGELLGISVLNTSYAGSSNDAIVRRVMPTILKLLKNYKPEELFVIVGWSSPERRDFFYDGEWRCFYPPEFVGLELTNDISKFKQIYLKYFWEKQEYITRYMQQNYLLHYFLKNKGIDHYFFDAFYERKHIDTDSKEFKEELGGMYNNIELEDDLSVVRSLTETTEEFFKIRGRVFKEKSFRSSLMIDDEHFDKTLWDGYHPNETGHELWAKELYGDLNDKINHI